MKTIGNVLYRDVKINDVDCIEKVRLNYSNTPKGFKLNSAVGAVAAVLDTMGCDDSLVIYRPVNYDGSTMSWACLRAAVNKAKERRVFKVSRYKMRGNQFLIKRVV